MAAEAKKKAAKKRKTRRKKVEAGTRGPGPSELQGECPENLVALQRRIESDGGVPLTAYRDPLGGSWQLLAALPIAKVKPTAFQRNLSETHVKRLSEKIDRLNRFLDPIIAIRSDEGIYHTPNGYHRTAALQKLGARTIVAIVVPEEKLAYQILALNTEKAHNVREKSLEAIRMARELQKLLPSEQEAAYSAEFEEAPFLTLGACYERKKNFSGGAYYPVLRRTDAFFEEKLGRALRLREEMANRLFELDAKVTKMVDALKEQGLKSPFLKTFVVARINPLRWRKGDADFDETLDTMAAGLAKLDPTRIKPHHLAGLAGAPPEEG